MQWLVYVHNLGENGEERRQGAVLAPSPLVPADGRINSFARVFIDELAPDLEAAVTTVVRELFRDYPPFEGVPASHMTELANLQICTGPGFEHESQIVAALREALADARKVA